MEPISTQEEHFSTESTFEKVSYYLLIALTFLFPLFFVPSISFPFEQTKIIFGASLVLLAIIFYIIGQVKESSVTVIKSPLLLSLLAIPVVFMISGFASSQKISSFLGFGYEIGTVSFVALGVLAALLIPLLVRSRERILHLYTAFLLSFTAVALFHIARFVFGPEFLSFGLLGNTTSNLIGKWNDLGAFFGLAALLSFLTLQFMTVGSGTKKLLYVTFTLSFVLMMVVNFTVGWYAFGFCALLVLLYRYFKNDMLESSGDSDDFSDTSRSFKERIAVFPLILLVISVVFIFAGEKISGPISEKLQISQIEVRPSWEATLDVAKGTLDESPVLGAGPNRFLNQFFKFKPDDVNASIFWNAEFHYGVGLIPTFLVTTGILGFLAWMIFFALYLYRGIKVLFSTVEDSFTRYSLISSFIASLYLWIIAFFYIPSGVLFMLAFIFTGIFIASLVLAGTLEAVSYVSLRSSKGGVAVIYSLIVVLIGSVAWTVVYAKQLVAGVYFQSSIVSLNSGGNIDDAEKSITKAAKWSKNDLYYQSLIEINLIKMNQLLSTATQANQEESIAKLQQLLGASIAHAQTAISISDENYQNWVSSGRIYEAVAPLQVAGAYDAAVKSYDQALLLNPKNPGLYLMRARLEASQQKYDSAKEFISKALELKSNYTEAVFLLSQIQVQQGDVDEAIASVEAATELSPSDPTLFFQLGFLKYNDKNYLGAVESMTKAVELNSQYSNARYFMGLSLSRLGRISDAVKQFEEIEKLNPENEEVKLILRNLRAGRPALAEVQPPLDTTPESRDSLPVSDN